jgi:hypothetical protein
MFMNTQILIWFAGIAVLSSILFIGWQGKPWAPPLSFRGKLLRSIRLGIGIEIFISSLLTFFDLRKSPNYIGFPYLISFLLLSCSTIPFGMIAGAGYFVSLSLLDKILETLLAKPK